MTAKEAAAKSALSAIMTPLPAAQLALPLDYLAADHLRQRSLCSLVERIADEPTPGREEVGAVLRFLREEFGLHIIDEEEDLFPLLRRRCEPEDRIEEVLGELSQEHASEKQIAETITEGLNATARSGAFNHDFRELLRRFAANERRHLVVENAIVLPLARLRLTADDLRNLGRRMAARRGTDYPGTGRC